RLLARLAARCRHERRFSAEISHELRTPLAKLIVEGELALRRDRSSAEYRAALQSVVDDARQMQRVIETLIAVARSEIDPRSGTSSANEVVRAVVDFVRATTPDLRFDVSAANGDLRLGVDADPADRVLAPVIENA